MPHVANFTAVRDSRNRRVPGIYQRNGRYYCQLWVELGNGRKAARRFPLLNDDGAPATNLNEAKAALEVKRHDRRENRLPTLGRKPLFHDYCATYFEKAKASRKRAGTLENERQAIARWRAYLGNIRIDKISTPMVAAFVDKSAIRMGTIPQCEAVRLTGRQHTVLPGGNQDSRTCRRTDGPVQLAGLEC